MSPLLVPWLTITFGWPTAFLVTGALGFIWLVVWWRSTRIRRSILAFRRRNWPTSAAIRPTRPSRSPGCRCCATARPGRSSSACSSARRSGGSTCTGCRISSNKQHGLDLLHLGPPLVTIYLMTDVGSIGGGWLSSWLIKRGWSVNAARKTAMLVCAPVRRAGLRGIERHQPVGRHVLIGLAASAHQGFSANLYTLVSDTVPRKAVSSVVGIGGMAGAIGGMFIAKLAGYILEWTGRATGCCFSSRPVRTW